MGNPAGTPTNESVEVQRAQYLWEEYHYRHDLIWRLLFRMTAVAVLLAITPFTINDVAEDNAGDWVLALPVLAVVLVAVSARVLSIELALFSPIDRVYTEAQLQAVNYRRPDTIPKDFERVVRWYPIALVVLLIGVAVIAWIELWGSN